MLKGKKNTQSEEAEQLLKRNSDMQDALELSERDCNITIINMLRPLMKIVDNT